MRNLRTLLTSQILFPLHERLKHHDTNAVRRRLEASQWWSLERIRSEQWARLSEFLEHIQRTVPFYSERLAPFGISPTRQISRAEFERIPLLDKSTIRTNLNALKANDAGPLQRFTTGGSSGEPLVFYLGRDRVSHDVAAKWRATRWWGVDIGDPEIVIWGSPIELGAQDRVRILRDAILRSKLLSAFHMADKELADIVRCLVEFKPRMLFGYPSALVRIAEYIERNGPQVSGLGIRVAFVTSEMLYEHQRAKIESVFGCPVANGYGSRDAGFIAHECAHGSMHISAEDIVVETVDAEGKPVGAGELGEIVVTHLATREFPFLRYRTGDMGVLSERRCPCGRGLPILDEIKGRTTDFVVASDGTAMHGLALIYILRDLPEVAAFKIVQESLSTTRVLIVPGAAWESRLSEQIVAAFKRRLGENVTVHIEITDRIPAEASGKFRYVVSKVSAA